VPHFQLVWQQAATLAAAFAVVGLLAPPALRGRAVAGRRWFEVVTAGAREGAVVMVLFTIWQIAAGLALTRVAGAVERAHTILRIESWLPLPTELTVQHWVLPHPDLVKAMNAFYLYVHINSITIFLIWLFLRHRGHYPWARNALVLLTAPCLLIQMVPVAPPRMLTGLGFVDTANLYGQSIYGPFGSGMADQLSAMPSVHVGWALLIAVVVIRVSTSRWRWLILAHPVVTTFVVVATANHFWLDGIVAAGILALALPAASVAESWLAPRRGASGTRPEPEPDVDALSPGSAKVVG
jgi:PAP2 superfamily